VRVESPWRGEPIAGRIIFSDRSEVPQRAAAAGARRALPGAREARRQAVAGL